MLPDALPGGRPRTTSLRQVMNAILYVLRSSGAWRLLPHDQFQSWETVYGYFRKWTREGLWQRIHDTLRADVRRIKRGDTNIQRLSGVNYPGRIDDNYPGRF